MQNIWLEGGEVGERGERLILSMSRSCKTFKMEAEVANLMNFSKSQTRFLCGVGLGPAEIPCLLSVL